MPVPKYKTSKTKSRVRHGAYKKRIVKKMMNKLNFDKCPDCGATKINHHVCMECGKYRGKQILDKSKEIDKITTIKA
jgi:large subunit ribosomal protein L32